MSKKNITAPSSFSPPLKGGETRDVCTNVFHVKGTLSNFFSYITLPFEFSLASKINQQSFSIKGVSSQQLAESIYQHPPLNPLPREGRCPNGAHCPQGRGNFCSP